MDSSFLITISSVILFLTGVLQYFLQEKKENKFKKWKAILLILMVFAFIFTLLQNLQNDRDNRNLAEKANQSISLAGRSVDLIGKNKQLTEEIVELNKKLAIKNEEIAKLSKKIVAQSDSIIEMNKVSTGGDAYCYVGKSKEDKATQYQVEVLGFDYYNTKTGNIESGGTDKIAMWMLDTDYDGRSLFPRQVFFPMAGEKDGWSRLAKNLKAVIDEELIENSF